MAENTTNNQNGEQQSAAESVESLKAEVAKLRGDKENLNIALHQVREEARGGKEAIQLLTVYNQILSEIKENLTVGGLSRLTGVPENELIASIEKEFPKNERENIDADTFLPDDSAKIAKLIEKSVMERLTPLQKELMDTKSELGKTKKEIEDSKKAANVEKFNNLVNDLMNRFKDYPESIRGMARTHLITALHQMPPAQAADAVEKTLKDFYGWSVTQEAEKSKKKKGGGVGHSGGEPQFEELPKPKNYAEALKLFDTASQRINNTE